MNTFRITEITSTTLSGREYGEEVRNRIVSLVSKSEKPITLDLENLSSFTPSFLEEAIVKLVFVFGKDNFKENINLINVNHSIKSLMNFMLSNQMKIRKKQNTPQ